jgi:hypothetical protein
VSRVIFIAGSGRSGTTWIQDAIADANDMRTLFEPLHPIGVPWSGGLAYRYLEPDEPAADLGAFLDTAFAGAMRSLWADYRIRPDRFNPFRYRLPNVLHNVLKTVRHYHIYHPQHRRRRGGMVVKCIRANLMLRWLAGNYDIPILYVVRHPAAVVASMLAIGTVDWSAKRAIGRYTLQRNLVELVRTQFGFDITRVMTPPAALTCVWCIENLLPLRWAAADPHIQPVAYETLLAEPEWTWRRVAAALALEHLPTERMLASPSQQSAPDKRNRPFDRSDLGTWRQRLTQEQLEQIRQVLDAFRVDAYDVDQDMPVASNLLAVTRE